MSYSLGMTSELGPLTLESDGTALTAVKLAPAPAEGEPCPVLLAGRAWLEDYFRGCPRPVDLPLAPKGTAFQQLVWQLLLEIPWGETCTYGDLAGKAAKILGREAMSAQAIGGAVGRNPLAIFIPCHRVVGAGNRLTGFAWGLEKKQWLLEHERRHDFG